MTRSVLLLLLGAAAGAAIVAFVVTRQADIAAAPAVEALPTADPATPEAFTAPAAADTNGQLATRLAAYERAATAVDAADLESMIDLAASRPRSRSRDLELTALVARLGETDPARAVEFALAAYLETEFLIQAFESWARFDLDAAASRLATVTPVAKRRRIALAMLAVVRGDERAAERLAEALPPEDRPGFAIDALAARAETDTAGALQELLAMDNTALQSLALSRLAEAAARQDPVAAMALAESIDDFNRRRSFQSVVMRAWADQDADAVLAYLETADPTVLESGSAVFLSLARADPDRVLAMIDELPPQVRSIAEQAARSELAERDPVAALAMVETMPPGQERDSMLQTVAQAYGRQNPELALAWVKSLSPPSDLALRAVMQGIAATDVDRAIDLLLAEIENAGTSQVLSSSVIGSSAILPTSLILSPMLSVMSANPEQVGRLVERLANLDHPQARSMLSTALTRWASRDSQSAVNWYLANSDRFDSSLARNFASQVAGDNLDLAIATLDQLPAAQRAGWIEGLASQMASSNVDQALAFVERYRGNPGHSAALGVVVTTMARTDPARAAGMLAEVTDSNRLTSASSTIAREWASRDPSAAAQWALTLGDPATQVRAINSIASAWAERDAAAAETWLFSLDHGAKRDAAIDGYLGAAARVGQFEPRLLEAYSSDEIRQRSAGRFIAQIASTDPERANGLLDTHVTDPTIREEIQRQIERTSTSGSGVIVSNGSVIFLR